MPIMSPIVTPKPGTSAATAKEVPVVPQVTDPTYEGVAVDTAYTPRGSLLTYVDGANWSVEYYRQLIGASNELSPAQTDRPGAFQQYELIHHLLLKVTSALNTTQDATSKSMMLTGSAITMPGLIPNQGDEFIADAGDGRAAVFVVTSSEKKSLLKDSVYQIEYLLKDYATVDNQKDLAAGVVRELSYINGNLMIGQNPLIATEDLTRMQVLKEGYALLLSQYLARFFSNEYQTLLVPDQLAATYDSFLVNALLSWTTTDEHPLLKRVRQHNVDGDEALKSQTLWDALSAMRADYLPMVQQQMGVTGVRVASRYPYFGSVYYSGMGQLVYPMEKRTDIDASYTSYAPPDVGALNKGGPVFTDLARLLGTQDVTGFSYQVTGQATLPDILPVTVDTYYVFSQGFYTRAPASLLEQLTMNALQGKAVDLAQLQRLTANAPLWGNLERFYYVPVLLALIKTQIGAV